MATLLQEEIMGDCSIAGCNKSAAYRSHGGLCRTHYQEYRRAGKIDGPNCLWCGEPILSHGLLCKDDNWIGKKAHAAGLDVHEVVAAFKAWDGRCELCEREIDARKAHLDHDHETGAMRGILCVTCNTGLGHLGDNKEGLERALAYVQRAE